MNGPKRSHRKSVVLEESFFPQPLLGDVQHPTLGSYGNHLGTGLTGGAGDILELEGHHIHRSSEGLDLFEILIRSHERAIGDRCRGGTGLRAENVNFVAQSSGGDGEHAPQLPPA
jgi:hypothetical protein